MGGVWPVQIVLGALKQQEQGSKQHPSMDSPSVSASWFLPSAPTLVLITYNT